MYGNIYQVHIHQMHVWEHVQVNIWEHQPEACIGTCTGECMGTTTRYISTGFMYGNIYQIHFHQMHVWERVHGECMGISTASPAMSPRHRVKGSTG
jgi:hypothetical protein